MAWHDRAIGDEYVKALSCQERAFFYASNQYKNPAAPSFYRPPSKASPPSSTADSRFALIITTYADAGEILIERLEEISFLYFNLQQKLIRRNIAHASRDQAFIIQKRDVIIKRYYDKIIELGNAIPEPKDAAKLFDYFRREWRSINSTCQLLMEEISFLTEKVDTFQNILKAYQAVYFTILGLIIAAGISSIGMAISHSDAIDAMSKSDDSSAQAIQLEFQKLTVKGGSLQKMETSVEDIQAKLTTISDALPTTKDRKFVLDSVTTINQELLAIKKSIDDGPTASSKAENDVGKKIDVLIEAMGGLKLEIDQISKSPSALKTINDELARVGSAINELQRELRDLPSRLPKPEPKKAIGLINISH